MNLLAFDTSTELLCACLMLSAPDGKSRSFEISLDAELRHAELLIDTVDQLCRLAGITTAGVQAVVCGRGPGSFTGLRIGMAGAKGMAEALGVPLASVPALDAIARGRRQWPGPVLALIDARKGRFYAGLYAEGHRQQEFLDIDHVGLLQLLARQPACGKQAILVTGPHADLLFERVGSDPELGELRSRLELVPDAGQRKGWGRDWAELGLERINAGNWDQPDFGPEYVRTSDAELGIGSRKPSA